MGDAVESGSRKVHGGGEAPSGAPAVPGVLHVISGNSQAGAERHVLLLARAQMEMGMRVVIAYRHGGWLSGELQRLDLPAVPLGMRGTLDFATILALRRIAGRERLPIIHGHLARGMSYAASAARWRNLRSVGTDHMSRPATAMPRLDAAITVSEDGRTRALAAGLRPERVTSILNGVDQAPLGNSSGRGLALRGSLGISPEVPVVGVLARVTPVKGHDVLLNAVSGMTGTLPRLVFAGPEDPRWRTHLDNVAQEVGVSEYVRFLGSISDVGAFLAACDVVVAPSRMEACGMSVAEAMCAGRPVIASAVGGMPELIQHGVTGLLVPGEDPEALAQALEALLIDPQRRCTIGRAAAADAASRFTVDAMVRSTLEVYVAALGAPRISDQK